MRFESRTRQRPTPATRLGSSDHKFNVAGDGGLGQEVEITFDVAQMLDFLLGLAKPLVAGRARERRRGQLLMGRGFEFVGEAPLSPARRRGAQSCDGCIFVGVEDHV